MIGELSIKNFQGHADTVLKFEPGINVITGPTNVGKSSVFRSLSWAVRNNRVKTLTRDGTKKTEVTIGDVTKIKTPTDNMYRVGNETYKALRSDVPVQVEDSLRLSELNFQGQHDTYFLISNSPGQVARTLNEVADLKSMDDSLRAMRARVKAAKERKELLKEQIKRQEEKIAESIWVREADTDYKVIEDLEGQAEKIRELELLISGKVVVCEERALALDKIPETAADRMFIEKLMPALSLGSDLSKLVSKVEENVIKTPDPREDLARVSTLQGYSFEEPVWAEFISQAEEAKAELSLYPETIADCDPVLSKLESSDTNYNNLSTKIDEVVVRERLLFEAKDKLDKGLEDYSKRLKELGKCPLCEGDL